MPRWKITLERPGVYQADNPLRMWTLRELVVNAPTARDAERHVIRTVQGDLGEITVTAFDGVLGQPPLREVAPDPPPLHFVVPE